MTPTGKACWALLLSLLLAAGARAALEASVDRQQVALGDSLRLTISASGDEDLNAIDMRPLQEDFEILQRSTNSSVNIINGRRSERRELVLDITPRREGSLQIPSLGTGGASTRPLGIEVGPAPSLPGGDAQVIFEAEVDRSSVYVQGQLLLTLRVQQAINLDARSVTELELDNAFVKPLEQKSFQRTLNGRPWLIHEIRYAIFPEQSGTLEIPAQTFSARESRPRRSLFDRGSGALVRRSSQPLQIEVLPRPADYPDGTTWLPAQSLSIEEEWSTPPEQLQVGQSATRTVRITGAGLQGAQLPPVLFKPTPGLKYYPDQPQITERETSTGLVGQRVDSAALVPTTAGHFQIPEIRIPWWDTSSGTLREAVLPAREFEVAPAGAAQSPTPLPAPAPSPVAGSTALTPVATSDAELWWWRGIALFSAIGWLATLAWLFWQRRSQQSEPAAAAPARPGEAAAYKALQAACAADQPARARQALLDWGRALYPEHPELSLQALAREVGDEGLGAEIAALERQLFADNCRPWKGRELAAAVKSLRAGLRQRPVRPAEDRLALYPEPAGAVR